MDNKLISAIVSALVGVFILLFAVTFVAVGFRPWFRCFLYGTPVPLVSIIAMRLRGNPPMLLTNAYIALRRAGLPVTIGDVENAYIDARSRVSTSDELVQVVKSRSDQSTR